MLKRLWIYLRERHPPLKTSLVSLVLFFEIYFLVVITADMHYIRISLQEAVGVVTLFIFLLSLRIADDLKDYESDKKLFPERPLPSGRVKKKDLGILLAAVNAVSLLINHLWMNNIWFYLVLMGYGTLMSVWFFARTKIQKSLPLALITHNPVQLIMNLYVISFACLKYDLPLLTLQTVLIAFTLYWPGLVWEISRKIRAQKDETEYTTYSKLFGLKKATQFVLLVLAFDVVTSALLMWQLWPWGVLAVGGAYVWLLANVRRFLKNPEKFTLVSRVELYELITEVPVVLVELVYLMGGWIQ